MISNIDNINKSKSILIIDDDSDFADSIVDILELHGYNLSVASNAIEAIDIIKSVKIYIALIDLRLGQTSGINLIEKIKKINPDILCIMITAYASIDTAIKALQQGAYDYLRKPINVHDLLATISRSLEKLQLEMDKSNANYIIKERNIELEEINKKMSRVVESTRKLASCTQMIQIEPLLLKEFVRNIDSEGGSLFLCKEDGLHLAYSMDTEHVPSFIPYPLAEKSIFRNVLSRKESILICDVSKEKYLSGSGWKGYKTGSLLIFPMLDETGKVFGIISLHNKTTSPFNLRDREIGSILASYGCETLRAIQAMEALFDSEEKFHDLAELLPQTIFEIDIDGKINYINRSGYNIFGYSKKDIQSGLNALKVISYSERERATDAFYKKINFGKFDKSEYLAKRKDGSNVPVEIHSAPIIKDDKIIGMRGIIIDITERKKAEMEQQRLNIGLMEKNKELEQIIYVTSHDLRSPLVNIQGFSGELNLSINEVLKKLENENFHERDIKAIKKILIDDVSVSLNFILSSTKKMDSLLAGLLRISRLGRDSIDIQTLDMDNILHKIISDFEYQIKESNVNIKIEPLPKCKGDSAQTNQVFSNLVGNAIKYLNKDRAGEIAITGFIKENYATYCIQDNGIGIAKNHQQKIFEMFHRLNPRGYIGDGLGLSIVQKIIDRHNGKVWLESEPGKGSKFYVSLMRNE